MYDQTYKKYLYVIILLVFQNGCAYFNTFYNAQVFYNDAEEVRLQKEGEAIPITALDKYGKVIEKCQKVLREFPKSRLRIDAVLLMAQARYYRGDYDLAINDLKQIKSEKNVKLFEKSCFWISLCKWKKGNTQIAKNELTELLLVTKSKDIKSACHLSLAEINKEFENTEEMIFHLENAAIFSRNRNQKSIIYGRLAEIAFNKSEYEVALVGYRNVISNSLSKDKIENAHLTILKIMRLEKNFKSAEKKIKSLLLDDKFKRISGNLELELVQLYRAQGEVNEIESRLESIVNTYQKSSVSAEAYYQLGQIYCSSKWDLKKAKEYFIQISKEYNKSFFVPMANSRIQSIETYINTQNELKNHITIIERDLNDTVKDSTSLNVSIKTPEKTIPELLYQLGDLEAFSFNRYKKGINFLTEIIDNHKESYFHAKSYFTIAFIYETIGDSANAIRSKNELLELYPTSDYSNFILNENSDNEINSKLKGEFTLARSSIYSNNSNALKIFKDIIAGNPLDILSPFAAFNIAYHYDQNTKIDSALKYYNWIISYHPKSEQSINSQKRVKILNEVLSFKNLEIDSKN